MFLYFRNGVIACVHVHMYSTRMCWSSMSMTGIDNNTYCLTICINLCF